MGFHKLKHLRGIKKNLSEKVPLEHSLPWGFYVFLLCWVGELPVCLFGGSLLRGCYGSQMDWKHQSYCCFTYGGFHNIWDLLSIVIQRTRIWEASNLPRVWSSSPGTVLHSEISAKYWQSSKASLQEVLGGKVEYVQGNTNVWLVQNQAGQCEQVLWQYC